jgi:catechol-2,3-dioxygenase
MALMTTTKGLSSRVTASDATRGVPGVRPQHHDLALFQLATGAAPATTQPGLHHTAWQLGSFAELQAAYHELRELGIPVDSTIAHNVSRSICFHDPDGNRVELYCDAVEAMRTSERRRRRTRVMAAGV